MTVQPGGQQPDGQQPDGRKLSGGAIASLTGVGVLLIYAAVPLLYFLSITVLRSGRQRNQEYADFT